MISGSVRALVFCLTLTSSSSLATRHSSSRLGSALAARSLLLVIRIVQKNIPHFTELFFIFLNYCREIPVFLFHSYGELMLAVPTGDGVSAFRISAIIQQIIVNGPRHPRDHTTTAS